VVVVEFGEFAVSDMRENKSVSSVDIEVLCSSTMGLTLCFLRRLKLISHKNSGYSTLYKLVVLARLLILWVFNVVFFSVNRKNKVKILYHLDSSTSNCNTLQ